MSDYLESIPLELPRLRLLCEDCGFKHRSNEACPEPVDEHGQLLVDDVS